MTSKSIATLALLLVVSGCDDKKDTAAQATKAEPLSKTVAKTDAEAKQADAAKADATKADAAKAETKVKPEEKAAPVPTPAPTPTPIPAPTPTPPPTPATVVHEIEATALEGPWKDLAALCKDTAKIVTSDKRCKAGDATKAEVSAPYLGFASLLVDVVDAEDSCIFAIQTDKGWYATGWSCTDPMVELNTTFVDAKVEDVLTGGTQELVIRFDESGRLDEPGYPRFSTRSIRVCGIGASGAPSCTEAIDVEGSITPEDGTKQTWLTKRTSDANGIALTADGALPTVHAGVPGRYVISLA